MEDGHQWSEAKIELEQVLMMTNEQSHLREMHWRLWKHSPIWGVKCGRLLYRIDEEVNTRLEKAATMYQMWRRKVFRS